MMGLFSQATSKMGYKPRGADEDKVPDDTEPDDTSILSVPPLSLSRCATLPSLTHAMMSTNTGTRMRALSLHRLSRS